MPLHHFYPHYSSGYQDGTPHSRETWYAKTFEDNQPPRTSPLQWTWIAGVDYDEDKFEDEDYDPNSDEDEDSNDSNDSDDDDDDEDMYDKKDPDAIAALKDPTTLQDDEDSEESDVKQQPQVKELDKEKESEEESEEEKDPNPTTAKEQTVPENAG
jgi:hypothetical protein